MSGPRRFHGRTASLSRIRAVAILGLLTCAGLAAPGLLTSSPARAHANPAGPFDNRVAGAAPGSGVTDSSSLASPFAGSPVSASFDVNPSTVRQYSQLTITYQISGGVAPYQLSWTGLPSPCFGQAPSSAPGAGTNSWTCSPSETGSFQVQLRVTDSATPPNSTSAPSRSLTVNSGGGGGGGNKSGNSTLPPIFSNLGSLLAVFLIVGIVAFILLVITAASTLTTAVIVARRLPPRSKADGKVAMVPCPACGTSAPADSKFCPACGKPMAPSKAS